MPSPVRFPAASRSIPLVWVLNFLLPGLGNVYAGGLSALRYLVIGVLVRIFVTHPGVLIAASVLLSLIATGEIIAANSKSGAANNKNLKESKPSYLKRPPKAINAPDYLRQTRRIRQEDDAELTDEFVRSHLKPEEVPVVLSSNEDQLNNLGYGDIHAGQLTYDTLGTANTLASSPIMSEPYQYDFQQYKFDSLNYQSMGTIPTAEGAEFSCPHCGVNGQNDFSFCLSCGHAYAIG